MVSFFLAVCLLFKQSLCLMMSILFSVIIAHSDSIHETHHVRHLADSGGGTQPLNGRTFTTHDSCAVG